MLHIKAGNPNMTDLLALGEVMLRLDPGDTRIRFADSFRVWEGGGEYNVAKALSSCFGLRTGVVTALTDNPIGQLICGRMRQGGVDTSLVQWFPDDGECRNGLNFTERGYGIRGAVGVSDRRNSAASKMQPGSVDWDAVFANVRWLHTGGIFAAISESASEVQIETMQAAKRNGVIVSYDLNYRPSLWDKRGGRQAAQKVNRAALKYVDVLFGNETDYYDALGVGEASEGICDAQSFFAQSKSLQQLFPNIFYFCTSLRKVQSAGYNDWSGVIVYEGRLVAGEQMRDLEVYDRVGGGDGFASGVIYGLLQGLPVEECLSLGIAHGALLVTTPGDTSMATLADVRKAMRGASPRIVR